MKKAYVKAFNELTKLGCPVFNRSDYVDGFFISAEGSNSDEWADYYNTYPWQWNGETTNPKIDEVLKKYKLFAEWNNPGCLQVFEN
jgi:hypothetical protein